MTAFEFYRGPRVLFGAGQSGRLGREASSLGRRALVVLSRGWSGGSRGADYLLASLDSASLERRVLYASGEPTPELVDDAVARYRQEKIEVVIAVGGGSVIDAAKAISAMLPAGGSVRDFLEGVGTGKHTGEKTPFIALPTTAGSGSEATKNAVLSRVGANGFKRSVRHDRFVPDLAIIDPELTLGCPPPVTAACGMDAFSQLVESYLSTRASAITDALALDAMERVAENIYRVYTAGDRDLNARAEMAYASFISGVTLSNAGLCVVHGLAAAVGALFPVPHGVVCGALLAPAIKVTVDRLRKSGSAGLPALARLARLGSVLGRRPGGPLAPVGAALSASAASDDGAGAGIDAACDALVDWLYQITEKLGIPRLSDYGVGRSDCDRILEKADNKNNPVALDAAAMREVILERIA